MPYCSYLEESLDNHRHIDVDEAEVEDEILDQVYLPYQVYEDVSLEEGDAAEVAGLSEQLLEAHGENCGLHGLRKVTFKSEIIISPKPALSLHSIKLATISEELMLRQGVNEAIEHAVNNVNCGENTEHVDSSIG